MFEMYENFEFEMLVFNLYISVLICCLMGGISAELISYKTLAVRNGS